MSSATLDAPPVARRADLPGCERGPFEMSKSAERLMRKGCEETFHALSDGSFLVTSFSGNDHALRGTSRLDTAACDCEWAMRGSETPCHHTANLSALLALVPDGAELQSGRVVLCPDCHQPEHRALCYFAGRGYLVYKSCLCTGGVGRPVL